MSSTPFPPILFAFGPGDTYVTSLPNLTKASPNLPDRVTEPIKAAKTLNFVVFPPSSSTSTSTNDVDAYVGHAATGVFGSAKMNAPSSPFCPGLQEWVKERYHGSKDMCVVGDGHGGWWGTSHTKKQKWANLSASVMQFLKPGNPHGAVRTLALGVEESYVVVFEDGHVDWDLRGRYDVLDRMLEGKYDGEVGYVALDPYRAGRFFAVFTDMTALYVFGETEMWNALEEEMLLIEGLRFISQSPTAKMSAAKPVAVTAAKGESIMHAALTGAMKDETKKGIESLLDSD